MNPNMSVVILCCYLTEYDKIPKEDSVILPPLHCESRSFHPVKRSFSHNTTFIKSCTCVIREPQPQMPV